MDAIDILEGPPYGAIVQWSVWMVRVRVELYLQEANYRGQNGFWQKKSEKCVMPSSMGDARGLFKELWRIWFVIGGSGGPPPVMFWIPGPKMVHSNAFLCHFTPLPITPPT